jgi:glycosyltransferase involved in cell wall biosynthesis
MKVLFLSHYFPPEVNAPASRTYEHCRVWAEHGHEVSVLTCVPNHPAGKIYPGYRNRLWQAEMIGGIRVRRIWTLLAANRGVIWRSANYFSYLMMAIVSAPFLSRTDVVISTSPQFFCGIAGYFVSRLKRAPWILEIRDLWPESIVTVGALKPSHTTRLLEWLEGFAYRKADRIVSVTDSFVERIAAKCGDPGKIVVIKNGVDLDFYRPAQPDGGLAREIGVEGRFVAAYVGTHGMAHGLGTILRAAEHLKHRKDIVFVLVGDGAERERLLREKQQLGLDNVLMLGQMPKDQMPRVWAITDVSLVLLRNQPLFERVLPSKVFEAMGAAKPIILGVRGESQRLIEASGGGLCIEPENAEHLTDAVTSLADHRANCRAMGLAGRQYVEQHFDRRKLAEGFEVVFACLARISHNSGHFSP